MPTPEELQAALIALSKLNPQQLEEAKRRQKQADDEEALRSIYALRNAGLQDNQIRQLGGQQASGYEALTLAGGQDDANRAVDMARINSVYDLGLKNIGSSDQQNAARVAADREIAANNLAETTRSNKFREGVDLSNMAGDNFNSISYLDALARNGMRVPLNNPELERIKPISFAPGAAGGMRAIMRGPKILVDARTGQPQMTMAENGDERIIVQPMPGVSRQLDRERQAQQLREGMALYRGTQVPGYQGTTYARPTFTGDLTRTQQAPVEGLQPPGTPPAKTNPALAIETPAAGVSRPRWQPPSAAFLLDLIKKNHWEDSLGSMQLQGLLASAGTAPAAPAPAPLETRPAAPVAPGYQGTTFARPTFTGDLARTQQAPVEGRQLQNVFGSESAPPLKATPAPLAVGTPTAGVRRPFRMMNLSGVKGAADGTSFTLIADMIKKGKLGSAGTKRTASATPAPAPLETRPAAPVAPGYQGTTFARPTFTGDLARTQQTPVEGRQLQNPQTAVQPPTTAPQQEAPEAVAKMLAPVVRNSSYARLYPEFVATLASGKIPGMPAAPLWNSFTPEVKRRFYDLWKSSGLVGNEDALAYAQEQNRPQGL